MINYNNQDTLAWEDVTVTDKDSKKDFISGVSGAAHSGKVTVIMSPSGGGKTTLLNALTNTVTSNVIVDKNIVYNNIKVTSPDVIQKLITFKTQDSAEFQNLTVYETIMLNSYYLNKSPEEHQDLVYDIVQQFNLFPYINHLISKISSGMKEKVNIICTLLSNSKVLLLDEALSKFDSSSCRVAINMIAQKAKENKIVIMTVHQPTPHICDLVDDLILMVDGSTIYQGPFSDVREYFGTMGFPLTDSYAYEMMDLITVRDSRGISKGNQADVLSRIKLMKRSFIPSFLNALKINEDKSENSLLKSDAHGFIKIHVFLKYFIMDRFRAFIINIGGIAGTVEGIILFLIFNWVGITFHTIYPILHSIGLENMLKPYFMCYNLHSYTHNLFINLNIDTKERSGYSGKCLFDFRGLTVPDKDLCSSWVSTFIRIIPLINTAILFILKNVCVSFFFSDSVPSITAFAQYYKFRKISIVTVITSFTILSLTVFLLTKAIFLAFSSLLINKCNNMNRFYGVSATYIQCIFFLIPLFKDSFYEIFKKSMDPVARSRSISVLGIISKCGKFIITYYYLYYSIYSRIALPLHKFIDKDSNTNGLRSSLHFFYPIIFYGFSPIFFNENLLLTSFHQFKLVINGYFIYFFLVTVLCDIYQ